MGNRISVFVIMIVVVALFAAPAFAQDDNADTAAGLVGLALSAFASLYGGAHLGSLFTDLVKKINFGWLTGNKELRLGGLMAEIAAIVLSALSAYGAAEVFYPFAQWLDQTGLYAVLLAAWPIARDLWAKRKLAKAVTGDYRTEPA